MHRKNLKADIVIIGAGISGLYAAWRILSEQKDKTVLIIEKLPKTGGRLDSDRLEIKGKDGKKYKVKDEEGGMRFNSKMIELYKLFKELGFSVENGEIVPFNMADLNGRFYLRGGGFTQKQVKDSNNDKWSELYNLKEEEEGKSPGTLIRNVLDSILLATENADILSKCKEAYRFKDIGDFPSTPDQWAVFRNEFSYQGEVIHAWGLWPLLTTFGMSTEAITLITKAIGFTGPIAQDINAGEQLQILCDFPNSPDFYTLNTGFESLPDRLESIVSKNAEKSEILLNTCVDSISESNDGAELVALNSIDGSSLHISCSNILVTLPKLALDKLLQSSPDLPVNAKLRSNLDRLQGMRLAKINLYFDERWWHTGQSPIAHGGSFTDLPAGAIYVFDPIYPFADSKEYQNSSISEKTKILNQYDAEYNGPSALTVYCDFENTTFWTQLQSIGAQYSGSHPVPKFGTAASTAVVKEALTQLCLIFDRAEVPSPVTSTFRLWGDDNFGFGYHQWKLNANDTEIREEIWKISNRVFLSNEAYSDMQGWVNGSLRSTDIMLERALNIKPLVVEEDRLKLGSELLSAAQD